MDARSKHAHTFSFFPVEFHNLQSYENYWRIEELAGGDFWEDGVSWGAGGGWFLSLVALVILVT
ncbi:MAG: hypothetical protein Q4B68_08690, partial [Bacteroidales bacterium]|nr:hypothetical protein [Bacteroidales bacterium]